MTHFLDTNCFRLVESYYPSRFPSFWRAFDEAVEEGLIASVSEVRKELEQGNTAPHVEEPGPAELDALRKIFIVPHFQGLVGQKQIITGAPVADPFLVAATMVTGGCVVTEERHKPNSTKIPAVCEHFGIRCTNLEGMLIVLDWSF